MRNPLDPSLDAALLLVEAKANVSFSVDDTLTLSGEVRSLDLSVVTFTPYFQTLSNAKGMNLKLTLATNMIESYANSILDNGYALPVPDSISPYIKNEKVVAKEGYLLIDGDCDFTQHMFLQAKLRRLDVDVKAAAQERFYKQVQDVYLFKLQAGELTGDTSDVSAALDEIMLAVNSSRLNPDWTQSLKDQQAQINTDFSQGVIQWTDLSLALVRDAGRRVIDMIMSSTDQAFREVKNLIVSAAEKGIKAINMDEVERSFDEVLRAAERASNYVEGIFSSIMGGN